jgi:hypothetical protein
MSQSTPFAERVRNVFLPTPRGVVGLVDDLLGLCRVYQLRLDFTEGHCSIRRLGADSSDALLVPLPKSVFRAVLARVAALCNEQRPGSVTPYRGEGEVVLAPSPSPAPNDSPSACYVSFTNTPSEQHLELRFSRSNFREGSRFTVLLRDQRTVTVFGHALNYIPHPNTTDPGSYGIFSQGSDGEVLVALFRVSEVVGVFSGDLHPFTESALPKVG